MLPFFVQNIISNYQKMDVGCNDQRPEYEKNT